MEKQILVFNAGSSSLKFSLYQAESPLTLLYEGEEVIGIGTASGAVKKSISTLERLGYLKPSAIGHRVVHSGPKLLAHQVITGKVLDAIEEAIPFAPLHQPVALEIIREAQTHFPEADQYACFDTVFHQTLPACASIFPLPKPLRDEGLHRYGFHGLSCESILQQFHDGRIANGKKEPPIPKKMILAHLGNGASVSAVLDGKSLDTSMGLTPCGGILMGTRSGDLDPGLIFYLLRKNTDLKSNEVEKLLNQQSGLLAISELSSDMHLLREAETQGNQQAALAAKMFSLNTKKIIGGYIALMGGLDALVFTGGIGEHDSQTRFQICEGLEAFGIKIGADQNKALAPNARLISDKESKTDIYVIHAEENRMIALHILRWML